MPSANTGQVVTHGGSRSLIDEGASKRAEEKLACQQAEVCGYRSRFAEGIELICASVVAGHRASSPAIVKRPRDICVGRVGQEQITILRGAGRRRYCSRRGGIFGRRSHGRLAKPEGTSERQKRSIRSALSGKGDMVGHQPAA